MSVSYHKELKTLSRAKSVISLLPGKAQFRVAKSLYDYESKDIHGIDLVAPLQNDGLVCFINTKDIIGWKIFFFGEYESGTNKILSKYIKKDDIVIEAGANLGSETLLISKLVGNGHVYAFEPNPYTFKRLEINVSINDLTNVSCYDVALGEKNGEINFHIYPKEFCNPGMSSKYMETVNTIKINVVQKTLDSFVKEQNMSKVDFVKMDIQGAEMDLVLGASETLSLHKPTIFTEAYALYNDTKQLYEKLQSYGYSIYLIGEDDKKLMATVAEVADGNWLAVYNK